MTALVVRDRAGAARATVTVDLRALQADAEAEASGGDPVAQLVELVIARIVAATGGTCRGRERTALGSALSNAVFSGEWPTTLAVTLSDVGPAVAPLTAPALAPPAVPRGAPAAPSAAREPRTHPPTPGAGANLPAELFDPQVHFPSENARRVYENLVGLDEVKARLVKEAIVLTQPERLRQWSMAHHGSGGVRALEAIRYGTPLVIFAGDVGTGKSALAESLGDAVARALGEPASLLRMSVQARGSGIVGDMTRQISRAFRAVEAEARRTGQVTILLLDEADALAETRETQQMHHEDRAGVNALIQGIDHLRGAGVPVLVVFCSNRLESIDPAVRRRAVDVVEFRRPDTTQRRAHLERLLGDLGLRESEWRQLVELTGPREGRPYGFTYSDIADRLVRKAVLEAFPDSSLSFDVLAAVAVGTVPTRPFGGEEA